MLASIINWIKYILIIANAAKTSGIIRTGTTSSYSTFARHANLSEIVNCFQKIGVVDALRAKGYPGAVGAGGVIISTKDAGVGCGSEVYSHIGALTEPAIQLGCAVGAIRHG